MKKPLNKLASILDGNRHSSIFVSLLSILLSLICASIILLILGKNPWRPSRAFCRSGFLAQGKIWRRKRHADRSVLLF